LVGNGAENKLVKQTDEEEVKVGQDLQSEGVILGMTVSRPIILKIGGN